MLHNGRTLSGERWSMHCPCCRKVANKRHRKAMAGILRRRERRAWQGASDN